jgi:hypothetical protein
MGEKVSGANRVTLETWKLKYRPLDVKCAGKIKHQPVSKILQINARHHASLLAKTTPYFPSLPSAKQGPEVTFVPLVFSL